jgi:hypothetical protein
MITSITRLLGEFLPEKYRDDIIGDLVEQSLPPAEVNRQLLGAIVRLFPLHFGTGEEENMKHAKLFAAAAILVVGGLQAWDSGILDAPVWISTMVVTAIVLGIAGVFIANDAARWSVVVVVFVLLFAARVMSPVKLPDLALVGLPVFLVLVLGPRFMTLAKEKNRPRGPGAAA